MGRRRAALISESPVRNRPATALTARSWCSRRAARSPGAKMSTVAGSGLGMLARSFCETRSAAPAGSASRVPAAISFSKPSANAGCGAPGVKPEHCRLAARTAADVSDVSETERLRVRPRATRVAGEAGPPRRPRADARRAPARGAQSASTQVVSRRCARGAAKTLGECRVLRPKRRVPGRVINTANGRTASPARAGPWENRAVTGWLPG